MPTSCAPSWTATDAPVRSASVACFSLNDRRVSEHLVSIVSFSLFASLSPADVAAPSVKEDMNSLAFVFDVL